MLTTKARPGWLFSGNEAAAGGCLCAKGVARGCWRSRSPVVRRSGAVMKLTSQTDLAHKAHPGGAGEVERDGVQTDSKSANFVNSLLGLN